MKYILPLLLVTLTACAQQVATEEEPDGWEVALAPERITTELPEGYWEPLRHLKTDRHYTIHNVPGSQTWDSWKEMITVEYFPSPKQSDLEKFYYDNLAKNLKNTCKPLTIDKPSKTSVATVIHGATRCGYSKETKSGEYTQYSIAKGQTGIHVIKHTLLVKPFTKGTYTLDADTAKKWDSIFNQSRFCTYKAAKEDKCFHM